MVIGTVASVVLELVVVDDGVAEVDVDGCGEDDGLGVSTFSCTRKKS